MLQLLVDSNDMECIMKVSYCDTAPSATYCLSCRAEDQWIQGHLSQDALLYILSSLHGATLRLVYRSSAQTLEITRDRTNMIGHIIPEEYNESNQIFTDQMTAEGHNRQDDYMDCRQGSYDDNNRHLIFAHSLLQQSNRAICLPFIHYLSMTQVDRCNL